MVESEAAADSGTKPVTGKDPAHVRSNKPKRFWQSIRPLLPVAAKPGGVGLAIFGMTIVTETFIHNLHDPHVPDGLILGLVAGQSLFKIAIEIAYAFIIASVVSIFIEATAKREQTETIKALKNEQQAIIKQFSDEQSGILEKLSSEQTSILNRSIKNIGASVFQGVYGIKHDQEYVKAVIRSCLDVRNFRRSCEINYNIERFSKEECRQLSIDEGRFVKVKAQLKYFLHTVGNSPEKMESRYSIPKRSGLLSGASLITSLRIGDKKYSTKKEISALEAKPENGDHPPSERVYEFEIPLTGAEPTEVWIESEFPKEFSDNEPFAFLLPTMGATIRVSVAVEGLRLGATARTCSPMRPVRDPDDKYGEWRIDGPLLPNNYVNVWWRSALDDGGASIGVFPDPESALNTDGSGRAKEPDSKPGPSNSGTFA